MVGATHTVAAQARAPNTLRGIALVLGAVLLFACMDVTTKHLAARYPVPLVVAVRYLGNLLLLMGVMAPRHGWALVKTERTGLVILRALFLGLASLCAGLALQRMPVAETTAIIFLSPIGVLLAAGPLLGERAGPAGWVSAAVSFAGVLMIARPGGGLDGVGVLFALATAATTIGYVLLSRSLARTESTMAMLFWVALTGAALFGAMLPWFWRGPAPGVLDSGLFLGIGALALAGHALFTAAFREAPASLLAPFNYVHLAWAGLLGWLVFGHVPDAYALAGIALIAASGAAIALKTHWDRGRG